MTTTRSSRALTISGALALSLIFGVSIAAPAVADVSPAPTLSAIGPVSGTTGGGDIVILTGSDLSTVSEVDFDGVAASNVSVLDDTSVTAMTPSHAAGAVTVSVNTNDGAATLTNGFTFTEEAEQPSPTLESIHPASGPLAGGTAFTLTGTGLTTASEITFGGIPATSVSVVNDNSVTAITPVGNAAGAVDVVISTSGGNATLTDGYTFASPPPTAVGNLSVPTVTGVAAVGSTLTADPGSWDAADLTYSYAWFSAAAQTTATGKTFTPTAADVGSAITVRVTATSQAGLTPGVATSIPTDIVVKGSLTPFVAGIVGSPVVGAVLAATPPAPPSISDSYQWKRGTAVIAGARSSTYRLTTADAGHPVSVTITESALGYEPLSETSRSAGTVLRVLTKTVAPTISGTVRVGKSVTAKESHWSPSPVTLHYQWLSNGTVIPGATKSKYTISASLSKTNLQVAVTGVRSGYLQVRRLSGARSVAPGLISAKTPRISGAAQSGHALTATPRATSPSSVHYSYQWYRNGRAVSGATSRTFGLHDADIGSRFNVVVIASKTGYSSKAIASAKTSAVKLRSASFSGSGEFRVGHTVAPGTYYTGNTSGCYWERDSGASGAFSEIIANDIGSGRRMVTIESSDAYFETSGCGHWYRYDGTAVMHSTIPGNGVFEVGVNFPAGTFQSSGSNCYWATLSDLSGDFDAIEDNYIGSGPTYVTLQAGQYFQSSGCKTWQEQ